MDDPLRTFGLMTLWYVSAVVVVLAADWLLTRVLGSGWDRRELTEHGEGDE